MQTLLFSLLCFADGALVQRFLQQWQNARSQKTALVTEETLDFTTAQQIRDAYLNANREDLGPNIGYKAALTNPAILKKFGLSEPIWGIMTQKMLVHDGANLDLTKALRPLFEGDLLVRVGKTSIQTAQTQEEVLAALDQVAAFIEVPDLVFSSEQKMNAPLLTAINAGASQGVMALPIELSANEIWIHALANIEVEIFDAQHNRVSFGSTSLLFRHPLDLILWLRDALAKEGKQLQPGDWISLGSLTPALPVPGPGHYRAVYKGFPGKDEVSISWSFQ